MVDRTDLFRLTKGFQFHSSIFVMSGIQLLKRLQKICPYTIIQCYLIQFIAYSLINVVDLFRSVNQIKYSTSFMPNKKFIYGISSSTCVCSFVARTLNVKIIFHNLYVQQKIYLQNIEVFRQTWPSFIVGTRI